MPQWAVILRRARENLVCSHGFGTLAERLRLSSNPLGLIPLESHVKQSICIIVSFRSACLLSVWNNQPDFD